FRIGLLGPTISSSAPDRPMPRKPARPKPLLQLLERSRRLNMLSYSLVLLDITFEPLQTVRPELLIVAQPIIDDAQRFRIQLTDPCCAFVFGHDQTNAPQQAKMF